MIAPRNRNQYLIRALLAVLLLAPALTAAAQPSPAPAPVPAEDCGCGVPNSPRGPR